MEYSTYWSILDKQGRIQKFWKGGGTLQISLLKGGSTIQILVFIKGLF